MRNKIILAVVVFIFMIGALIVLNYVVPQKKPTSQSTNTVASTPTGVVSVTGVSKVKVWLVALDDNGKIGKQIGCGDSLVAIEKPVESTTDPVKTALNQLFAIKQERYGPNNLYNAVYSSDLAVDRVQYDNNSLLIDLSGDVSLGGTCDNPRFLEQITETARVYSNVTQITIYINGKKIEDVVSEK